MLILNLFNCSDHMHNQKYILWGQKLLQVDQRLSPHRQTTKNRSKQPISLKKSVYPQDTVLCLHSILSTKENSLQGDKGTRNHCRDWKSRTENRLPVQTERGEPGTHYTITVSPPRLTALLPRQGLAVFFTLTLPHPAARGLVLKSLYHVPSST